MESLVRWAIPVSRAVTVSAALFCLALGCLVLLGWAIESELLVSVLPGFTSVSPNTALAFALSGLSILGVRKEKPLVRRLSWIFALLVGLIGAATLLEYFFGLYLPLDTFFRSPEPRREPPGMAPNTAVAFLFSGAAMLALFRRGRPSNGRSWAQILIVPVILLSYLALLGYFFDVEALYDIGHTTAMAVHTAAGLLVLSMAVLFCCPGTGFMSVIHADSLGGYTFRKFFPFALLAPLLAGVLQFVGVERGLYPFEFGVVLGILFVSGASAVLTWLIAKRVHLLDLERRRDALELSQSLERFKFLQDAMEAAASAVHVDELLNTMLKKICQMTRSDSCAVFLVSPDEKELRLRRGTGLGVDQDHGVIIPAKTGFAGKVLKTGAGSIVRDPEALPAASPVRTEKKIRSLMVAPIRRGAKSLGLLHVGSVSPQHFAKEDLVLLQLVADRIGSAIDRARLFESEILARKQAETALSLRNEFISIASHELKTPLTSLKLQCQILDRTLREGKNPEKIMTGVSKLLDIGQRQLERLTRLVDDMLDISRISAGKLTLERQDTNFAELLRSVVDHLQEIAEAAGCPVSIDADPGVIGSIDRFRMEQVITNLLSNAVKYGRGQPIEISLRRRGDQAEIQVRDFGIGISQEDQRRIFERFERTAQAAEFGGMGLGLYISKEIVSLHGGTVRVESQLGEGSVFTVLLPLKVPSEKYAQAG